MKLTKICLPLNLNLPCFAKATQDLKICETRGSIYEAKIKSSILSGFYFVDNSEKEPTKNCPLLGQFLKLKTRYSSVIIGEKSCLKPCRELLKHVLFLQVRMRVRMREKELPQSPSIMFESIQIQFPIDLIQRGW